MIQHLIDLKDWVKDRLEERTTWDGAMLVACLLYTSDAADE